MAVTPGPDSNLTAAMVKRASDLADYMRQRGLRVAVASDLTPNGTPCTVILAIGDWSKAVRDAGEKITAEIVKLDAEANTKAEQN